MGFSYCVVDKKKMGEKISDVDLIQKDLDKTAASANQNGMLLNAAKRRHLHSGNVHTLLFLNSVDVHIPILVSFIRRTFRRFYSPNLSLSLCSVMLRPHF